MALARPVPSRPALSPQPEHPLSSHPHLTFPFPSAPPAGSSLPSSRLAEFFIQQKMSGGHRSALPAAALRIAPNRGEPIVSPSPGWWHFKKHSCFLFSILKRDCQQQRKKRAKNTLINPKCREEVQMVRDKGTAALHRLLPPSASFLYQGYTKISCS